MMLAKSIRSQVVRAVGAALAGLVFLLPTTTHAEAVTDEERMGEWDEEGERFGSIVIKGELVASAAAPGGWTLVRTYENESDDAASCDLEERVLRTETMQGARVSPAPVAVLVRHQKIKLGPREKKAIGVYLPPALTDRMTESDKIARSIAAQVAAGNWSGVDLSRIYSEFRVDYLRPLPPGATAAIPVDNGIRRPERMAMEGSRPQSPKDAL